MSGALLQSASVAQEPLSLARDKSLVTGSGSGFTPCGDPGSTDIVTMTASGGKAPYSYAWAQVGGSASSGPYAASAPTSNATAFVDANSQVCDGDAVTDETWRCTVTDDDGKTATNDVTVRLTWANIS